MLEVILRRKDGLIALVLDGHAGAGEYGHDIVCASASMLAYTLAEAIRVRGERGMFSCEPIIALSPGSARIVCAPTSESAREVDMIFEIFADGYRMLARSYPENVVLHDKNDASPERA